MIQSPLLPEIRGYIDGHWVESDLRGTLPVVNPADGALLASVPAMGEAEAARAVDAAAEAMRQPLTLERRRSWLKAMAEAMGQQRDELARIITLENGKPLKESRAEVDYAAGFFSFFAEHLHDLEPRVLPEPIRDCRWVVHHRPAGVAGLITPWNFPLAMLAKKLPAALGAGCAAVVKPASETPLAAMALCALAEQTGLPGGWLNLVTGEPEPIGRALCTHPRLRLISFTGSTEVGRILAAQCAPHVKRLALELGGNAPFIVFEDADLAAAADALLANKFRAGGQTCVCTNRVYVQRRVAAEFARLVAERVARLQVGNGLEAGTDIGPLINRAGFEKVRRHVQDALEHGARRVAGQDPHEPVGDFAAFFPPTVLLGVTPEMLVTREETFGPVAPIAEFETEEQAIDAANSTPFGLASYLFTADGKRAQRVIDCLQFGHVGLNTGTGPTPEAPFGGMKQSGYGREGGLEGLLEYTDTQVVAEAV